MLKRFRDFFNPAPDKLTPVTVRVDDSPGWGSLTNRPHDYDPARVQEIYADALEAWRKNPIAWRTIAITTDFIVGDRLTISSSNRGLDRFIKAFWDHPKNNMSQRLDTMSEELARAGDLFVLLFRNPLNGMSYIRFVTKDRIEKIECAPNDWETELTYYETQDTVPARPWLHPEHPASNEQDAIMLHYSINKPMGALLGESDLVTQLPWLLRYSRMLEDRVRLNWAMRAFLWIVTVPASRVKEKQEQYRTTPEPGSILVKDESENWEANAPKLNAYEAKWDMQAVRAMIDAGSGYPPHWRGDAGDISLATAQAMSGPTERHLRRRQLYFVWMIEDILYHAYNRSRSLGRARKLTSDNYAELFEVSLPEISRFDNESLSIAGMNAASAFSFLSPMIAQYPPYYAKTMIQTVFKFLGEPIPEDQITQMLDEIYQNPPPPPNPAQTPTPGGKPQ
jgi:hypothetical protein